MNNEKVHVLSVLVENEFGVLARVAGLFAARGFNIESLTVGATHDETLSRMTIVVQGGPQQIDQVRKQLTKLVEVVAVQDLTEGPFVTRELLLLKVATDEKTRVDVLNIARLFEAKPIDYTPTSITLELVGSPEKLDNFITFLQPFGISEIGRSGAVGMNRGPGGLQTTYSQKPADRAAV